MVKESPARAGTHDGNKILHAGLVHRRRQKPPKRDVGMPLVGLVELGETVLLKVVVGAEVRVASRVEAGERRPVKMLLVDVVTRHRL